MPDDPLSDAETASEMDRGTLWRRKAPKVLKPRRNAGTLLRSAEFASGSGGVPLAAGEDMVVNVVRMAYKVASAQIDRSTRLARRLRESGEKVAGAGVERQALDGMEKLVTDSFLSGLEWWEASVADGRCPVKRLVAAEYQMLGSVLGLSPIDRKKHAAPAPPGGDAQPKPGDRSATPAPQAGSGAATAPPDPQIVLKCSKEKRRRVTFLRWQLSPAVSPDEELYFAHEGGGAPMPAKLELPPPAGGAYRLVFDGALDGPPGLWVATICDPDGVQIGFVEIRL